MSPKQWLALFCFYISYLFFGASVFYHIEHELEATNRAIDLQHRIDINEILVKYTSPNDTNIQDEILRRVSDYCGKPVTNYTLDTYTEPMIWSFYHAFFFSFTVCSTVGYGNISPSNTFGRMFMIFYALIGIPVNGFLFAYLGEFFGKVFLSAYERYKAYKMATTKNYAPHRLGLIAQIILYLLPGIVIFLLLPSLIFSYFEEWPFSVSLYYSFVTLSTIGFGDFVPTFEPHQEQHFGFMFHVYEVFIIFWFIFGLGYLVMIMGFIAKGLRSKHLTRLEHQLAENIKATQSRIWHGVTKDVGYLRRILNEVYIMKVKPVYTEPGDNEAYSSERRSSSCPDLSIYAREPTARKRAQSVFYPNSGDSDLLPLEANLHRVHSDSNLSRVDRKRTFDDTGELSRPSEMLARVVNALNSIKVSEDDTQSVLDMGVQNGVGGINGFTDAQILASERMNGSRWSLTYSDGSFAAPIKKRTRAASEFQPPLRNLLHDPNEHEWTWCGNNSQIQEFRRLRKLNKQKSKDLYRASFALPKNGNTFVINIDEPLTEAISPAVSNPTSLFSRLNPFKKRTTNDDDANTITPNRQDVQNYLDQTSVGRESRVSMTPQQYLSATTRGRASNFSILSTTEESNVDILENTTIADLIRALEVVHTKAVVGDEPLLQDLFDTPKRKLGTASLSPPSSALPPLINVFPPNATDKKGRRSSLRPLPTQTQTPVFGRANMARRQSAAVESYSSARRSSLLLSPTGQPPPYSEATPRPAHRRFSVRPTALSIPPGQAPKPTAQAASTLQRRLSTRPFSPLANDNYSFLNPRTTGRMGRSISASSGGSGGGNLSPSSFETPTLGRKRNLFLSPVDEAQLNDTRIRRGSRSQLFEMNKHRRRSESK